MECHNYIIIIHHLTYKNTNQNNNDNNDNNRNNLNNNSTDSLDNNDNLKHIKLIHPHFIHAGRTTRPLVRLQQRSMLILYTFTQHP